MPPAHASEVRLSAKKTGPWPLIKCAIGNWSKDQSSTISAALAFYCVFSLAPLLVILVNVTGWIVGTEAAYGQLTAQLTALFGEATSDVLQSRSEVSRERGYRGDDSQHR